MSDLWETQQTGCLNRPSGETTSTPDLLAFIGALPSEDGVRVKKEHALRMLNDWHKVVQERNQLRWDLAREKARVRELETELNRLVRRAISE